MTAHTGDGKVDRCNCVYVQYHACAGRFLLSEPEITGDGFSLYSFLILIQVVGGG